MMKRKSLIGLAGLALFVALAAGCSDDDTLKKEVQQSVQKQIEMKSYSFTGSANVHADVPQPQKATLTSQLTQALANSQIEWQGAVDSQAARGELKLNVKPDGSQQSYDLSMLFKDNKMYVNTPLVNAPDEYFAIDLAKGAQIGPLSAETLQMNDMFVRLFGAIADAIEPGSFQQSKASDASDQTVHTITAEVDDKHKEAFLTRLYPKVPGLLDTMASYHIITSSQLQELKSKLDKPGNEQKIKLLEQATLNQPLQLQLTVDGDGRIVQQTVKLDLTLTPATSGKPLNLKLDMNIAYDSVDQAPSFKMEVPSKTVSIDRLLQFIKPVSP